jgi:hypothetical protein
MSADPNQRLQHAFAVLANISCATCLPLWQVLQHYDPQETFLEVESLRESRLRGCSLCDVLYDSWEKIPSLKSGHRVCIRTDVYSNALRLAQPGHLDVEVELFAPPCKGLTIMQEKPPIHTDTSSLFILLATSLPWYRTGSPFSKVLQGLVKLACKM